MTVEVTTPPIMGEHHAVDAGPFMVGVPFLAATRLSGGAAALGIVFAAYAAGSLGGMIGAAGLPRPSDRLFGWIVIGLFASFAVAFAPLAFVSQTWVVAVLMIVTGLGNGYVAVTIMTSLQRITAGEFLGRVMSLVMLSMVGLIPISQAVAGAVLRISPAGLFLGAASGFAAMSVLAFSKRALLTVDAEAIEGSRAAQVAAEAA